MAKTAMGFTDESSLDLRRQREKVYDEMFGEGSTVYHEMVPFIPHVDVYLYAPSAERDFYTYITGGMSDLAMCAPAEAGADAKQAEIVFYAAEENREYSELLRRLAHFPHDNKTWFHWGHTMPNGNPPEPVLGSSNLDTLMFMPSIVTPDSELGERLRWQGEPVNLLWLVPITTRECNLKLAQGMDAIYDLFDDKEHPFVFRGDRDSYV